jgi:tagatose-1,6-bisphosphate aldolase
MNRTVEKNDYIIPNDLIKTIKNNIQKLSKYTDHKGYQTAINLINQKNVSGYNLKRIKNTLENGDKVSFYLLGGQDMLNWINYGILHKIRRNCKSKKTRTFTTEYIL